MIKKLLLSILLLGFLAGGCYIVGRSFGWVGVIAVIAIFVIICALQFYRIFKLIATIQHAPEGVTQNAVWLSKQIKPGMSLVKVVQRARALGKKISDSPEIYIWQDSSHCLEVTLTDMRIIDIQIKKLDKEGE